LLSKSQIKLITGLGKKKYRDQSGLFVAEGPKVIGELLESGLQLHTLFATDSTLFSVSSQAVTEAELKKISFLKTANKALAVFHIPKPESGNPSGLTLALDSVRDPGNLGTIIRLCDWFNIKRLVCSTDSADCYNPKVIQATMGSIARVEVQYTDLLQALQKLDQTIYGACMEGENVYGTQLSENAVLVMGNEANGISDEIFTLLDKKISIPQFGAEKNTESLNVATATAIMLSEFRRSTEK
jgi:TrmH family RNA methyltransferase